MIKPKSQQSQSSASTTSELTGPLTTALNLTARNPFWMNETDLDARLSKLASFLSTFAEAADMTYPGHSTEVWTIAGRTASQLLDEDPLFKESSRRRFDLIADLGVHFRNAADTGHGEFHLKARGFANGISGFGFSQQPHSWMERERFREMPSSMPSDPDQGFTDSGIKIVQRYLQNSGRGVGDIEVFTAFYKQPQELNPRISTIIQELPQTPQTPTDAAGIFMCHYFWMVGHQLPLTHFKETMATCASLLADAAQKPEDLNPEHWGFNGPGATQLERVCKEAFCHLSKHLLQAGHKDILYDIQDRLALSNAQEWATIANTFLELPAKASPVDCILDTLREGSIVSDPSSTVAVITALSESRARIKALEEAAELKALLASIPVTRSENKPARSRL